MLSSLHIRNFVLIDSLDIDFPAGLIIITGQTGAGKSILMGALGLLLGGKSDASVISVGADNCVVEAEFDDVEEPIRTYLEDNEVDCPDGHIIVRRVIGASGRSRSFVNDCPVSVSLLSEVSSRLIDIHSQHQSLLLCDRAFQLSLLDHYSGNGDLLKECRGMWKNLLALRSELKEVNEKISRAEDERNYNEALYSRLESAHLSEGELEDLESEHRILSDAESIKGDLSAASDLMSPASESGGKGMTSALKELSRLLSRLSKYIPECADLASRVESSRMELSDIESDIESFNEKLTVSPERLAAVEDRMSELYDLMHRHSCGDIASLIARRDELSRMLFDASSLYEKRDALVSEVKALEAGLESVSGRLRESRKSHSSDFAENVTKSLHFLELDRSVFTVSVDAAPQGATGYDMVTYRFSADGKSAPVDVSKCASGGEMSRIMLCLKSLMAHYTNMPTMIFDEIDTGVSGSVADKMGSMICSMGREMQIFAITHLPQVAAKGVAHYLVSKEMGDRTISSIRKLDESERVMELARMLSGSTITDAAIANAESLLKNC